MDWHHLRHGPAGADVPSFQEIPGAFQRAQHNFKIVVNQLLEENHQASGCAEAASVERGEHMQQRSHFDQNVRVAAIIQRVI